MASVEASEIQQPVVYEGVESPNSAYVRLVSSDSHEFYFRREYALTKGTVKAMISGPGQFKEREENRINLRKIPSCILERIFKFFAFNQRYVNSITEIPEFPTAPESSLELPIAINFLKC